MHPILQRLCGDDRRSIGLANEVAAAVLADPAKFRIVFEGLSNDDPLIRMRAADVLEKVTKSRPEFLKPYKRKLLAIASETEQIEVRWHAALMIPRLALSAAQRAAALDILFDYLQDHSSIVRTCAMDALAQLASGNSHLRVRVLSLLHELVEIGTPAMRARGRKLLQGLNRPRLKA
jgi:HEAT repeat protein